MRSGSQNNVDRVKRASIKDSCTNSPITTVASQYQRPLGKGRSKIVEMDREMALELSLLPKESTITSHLHRANEFARLWLLSRIRTACPSARQDIAASTACLASCLDVSQQTHSLYYNSPMGGPTHTSRSNPGHPGPAQTHHYPPQEYTNETWPRDVSLMPPSRSLAPVPACHSPRRSPHMSAPQLSQLSRQPLACALTNRSYRRGRAHCSNGGPL